MMVCEPPIQRGPYKGQTATGTHAGYVRHRRAGEQPCPACVAGKTRAERVRNNSPDGAWFLPDELLDWLEVDGGWLTASGIAVDLGRHEGAVARVLRQLRDEGLVEARVVELAHVGAGGRGGCQQRTEWRIS